MISQTYKEGKIFHRLGCSKFWSSDPMTLEPVMRNCLMVGVCGRAKFLIAIFKHLSVYLQISVVFILHQEEFSMQKLENTTEKYNQSIGRVVDPRPSGYIYKTLLHLRFREHCKRRDRKLVRVRVPGSLLRNCVFIPTKSQHDCPNVS